MTKVTKFYYNIEMKNVICYNFTTKEMAVSVIYNKKEETWIVRLKFCYLPMEAGGKHC